MREEHLRPHVAKDQCNEREILQVTRKLVRHHDLALGHRLGHCKRHSGFQPAPRSPRVLILHLVHLDLAWRLVAHDEQEAPHLELEEDGSHCRQRYHCLSRSRTLWSRCMGKCCRYFEKLW